MTTPLFPYPPSECWYSAAQCAALVHCHVSSWWGIAKASRILRAGRIEVRGKTFWLATHVNRYLRTGVAAEPAVSP